MQEVRFALRFTFENLHSAAASHIHLHRSRIIHSAICTHKRLEGGHKYGACGYDRLRYRPLLFRDHQRRKDICPVTIPTFVTG